MAKLYNARIYGAKIINDGNIVATYEYDAWGKVTDQSGEMSYIII